MISRYLLFALSSLILGHVQAQETYFKDVSLDVGLDYHYPGHSRQEVGAGVTVFDANNDGWDDIFQSSGYFESKLWINHKGVFKDETDSFGLDSIKLRYIQGAVSGDFDNDGYEDLILTNLSIDKGDKRPPVLLRNVRGERFEEIVVPEMQILGHFPGASWGDFNRDGLIDLYLLNYVEQMVHVKDSLGHDFGYEPHCFENKFYLNRGNTNFEEIGQKLMLNDSGCGLACMFTDYDNDQDLDIILLNDFGHYNGLGNRIFRNDYPKERFTDVSDTLGFYQEFYGMGIGAGDINFDGYLDYYLTNIGNNSMFLNHKDSMINASIPYETALGKGANDRFSTSWTGLFFDVENDADLDLLVAKGFLESLEISERKEPNQLLLQEKDGTFVNVSSGSGINDSIPNRGAALIDFDHDGDLDVVINALQVGRSEMANVDQKIKIYENITNTKNKWIAIKLIGEDKVNTSALGCKVMFQIGDKWYSREVDGGSGHSSQSSKILYFGIGKKKKIESIKITWIGKDEEMVIESLKANRFYQIYESGKVVESNY